MVRLYNNLNLPPIQLTATRKIIAALNYVVQQFERSESRVITGTTLSLPTPDDYPEYDELDHHSNHVAHLSIVPDIQPADLSQPIRVLPPGGLLPNDITVTDYFSIDRACMSPFRHNKYLPGGSKPMWNRSLMTSIRQLTEIRLAEPRDLIQERRYAFVYLALPQLLLRCTGKTKHQAKLMTTRCLQFLRGNYATLFQEWDSDCEKAFAMTRTQISTTQAQELTRRVKHLKRGFPRATSKVVKAFASFGIESCDQAAVLQSIRAKFPSESQPLPPPLPTQSTNIDLPNIMPIIAKADPEVGVGPRGFHSQYLKGLNEEETKEFAKLCEHSLTHNDWFTTRFQGSIVTAIAKNAQRETRPACAKDRDAAAALQGAQKLFTNATRLSCEHETSVGVKGGTQLCAWGFKCCMEEARRNERPFTILTEDRINAHNTFFRHKTIEEMQFLAQTNPEIEKMLAVSQPILSSKNPVYFRTRSSPSGLSHLTNCCEGGEQGNAMTNLHYPLTFQSVIRQANARFENTIVKSYQDDVFLMASAEDMFCKDKVL